MFEHLLVPVDDSETADKAMKASIALARQLKAAITGFVAEPHWQLGQAPRAGLSTQRQRAHDKAASQHALGVLARFEAQAVAAGVPFQGLTQQSMDVDEAIVQAAQARHCDMIVMVTHGRGPFGERLFGSHTKSVMARCKLPLLVLH